MSVRLTLLSVPWSRAVAALLGISLLAVSGCGNKDASDVGDGGSGGAALRSQVARAAADNATDLTDATAGLRGLGSLLAQQLPADSGQDGNQVFSAASLAIAFAMVREGTDDQASQEIDQVIGLPANRQPAYNRITHALTDVGDGDTLEINDAFFVDPDLVVRGQYLDAIQRWYGAGVRQTQFPSPALEDINGWVDARTHGRIPHLLDQLDDESVATLVNTIYLNAKWARPFDKDETRDNGFTTGAGKRVTVKTMHSLSSYDYATGSGWQAVRLPYAGGKLSMWVLLPNGRGDDPRELLAPEVLAAAARDAGLTEVNLSLPRWDTETKASLGDLLYRQGMTSVFDTGHLGRMSPDPKLYVSDIVQQANITVGEKGTVAAAATAVVFEAASGPAEPPGVEFTADHPFAFAIVHDETGVPLFEGVVNDPSAG